MSRRSRRLCCTLFAIILLMSSLGDAQTAHAQDASAKKLIANSIGMKLVKIPAGEFIMGSPRSEPQRNNNEFAHRIVITRPFYMGVYEVTQSQFSKVMGNQSRARFRTNSGGGPDHPMENVPWKEADEFCKKLTSRGPEKAAGRSYRLPTEAEWEYACRAGASTAYHFGETISTKQANFNGRKSNKGGQGTYLRKTARVGSYPPNAFGLYDMHGNVAEWCADWYDPDYYDESPEEDPLGPPLGALSDNFDNFFLVVRGGSWLDDARALRSANRQRAMHRNKYETIGFRVVCEIENPSN